jgi:hypothetical protein
MTLANSTDTARDAVREATEELSAKLVGPGHEGEPLLDYALVISTATTLAGTAAYVFRKRRALPKSIPLTDLLLLGLATTRASRLVSRDKVGSVLRAPFTEVKVERKEGSVHKQERPRGRGWVRALGELVTCPRCVGIWASGMLTIGYVAAPKVTRFLACILASASFADHANAELARVTRA